MNRISVAIVLGAFLLPSFAFAATITLSPSAISMQQNGSYTVLIYVTPEAGEKIYTVKASLSYPESITPTGFSFAPSWLPLTQSGYDSMGNGSVTKTAGYPGGISSQTLFGTLSLRAGSSGSGTIAVTTNSQTLNADNANVLSSRGSSTFSIVTPPSPPPQPPSGAPSDPVRTPTTINAPRTTSLPSQTIAATGTTSTTSTDALLATTSAENASQVAAAASGGTITPALALLIAILAFGGGILSGYAIRRF